MSEPLKMTPEAQERVQAARELAMGKLSEWGVMRVLHGVALTLMFLGCIAPVAIVTAFGFFSSSSSEVRLLQLGFGGVSLAIVGVALAGVPFFLVISQRVATALFGMSCLGLGIVLVPFFISQYTSMVGQLSLGYYALLFAFAVLIFAYRQRIEVEMQASLDRTPS